MNTQTERPVRKPVGQRGKPSGSKRYKKQTAHVGARRDGKPLIFGWGAHLTHTEKVRLQRRATWTSAVVVFLILAGVLVGTWINLNIIIPGEAITTVNGHAIPQSEYRAMVAVSTQLELNYLYGPHGLTARVTGLETQDAQTSTTISQTNTQITNLKKQIAALPAGSSQNATLTKQLNDAQNSLTKLTAKHQDLQNQINTLNNTTIPNEKQNFTQSQFGNVSATDLQDDEVLREWLSTQSKAIQNEINPSATQVTNSYNSLNINMPTTNGYNTFLRQMISNDQIRAMLTILDRRANAQKYFSSLLNSPSYQVEARQIVLQTQAKANEMLQDLQKGQDFAKLATQNSQDSQTKTKGGALGWLTFNQYVNDSDVNGPPKIENWLFDPARKVNEISPVIYTNGSYYIVQITAIDHSRAVDATVLKALKGNALVNWLSDQRVLSNQHITNVDQNKLLDAGNMPPNGILPSSPPASNTNGAGSTTP